MVANLLIIKASVCNASVKVYLRISKRKLIMEKIKAINKCVKNALNMDGIIVNIAVMMIKQNRFNVFFVISDSESLIINVKNV